jgi:hypothetical protein
MDKIGTGHFIRIRQDSGLEGFGLARLHCTYIRKMNDPRGGANFDPRAFI